MIDLRRFGLDGIDLSLSNISSTKSRVEPTKVDGCVLYAYLPLIIVMEVALQPVSLSQCFSIYTRPCRSTSLTRGRLSYMNYHINYDGILEWSQRSNDFSVCFARQKTFYFLRP